MKSKIIEEVQIPEGVECSYSDGELKCKKGDKELSKPLLVHKTKLEVKDGKVVVSCEKGNKKDRAGIKTFVAHVRNMFKGLDENFVYELEVCHVHFPMTVKVEGNEVVIDNFLGEKHKRRARILEGVEVEVKGNQITVKGHDVESAGQTAANIEKAARVPKKDRRIFQDGIFMTSKKGRVI